MLFIVVLLFLAGLSEAAWNLEQSDDDTSHIIMQWSALLEGNRRKCVMQPGDTVQLQNILIVGGDDKRAGVLSPTWSNYQYRGILVAEGGKQLVILDPAKALSLNTLQQRIKDGSAQVQTGTTGADTLPCPDGTFINLNSDHHEIRTPSVSKSKRNKVLDYPVEMVLFRSRPKVVPPIELLRSGGKNENSDDSASTDDSARQIDENKYNNYDDLYDEELGQDILMKDVQEHAWMSGYYAGKLAAKKEGNGRNKLNRLRRYQN